MEIWLLHKEVRALLDTIAALALRTGVADLLERHLALVAAEAHLLLDFEEVAAVVVEIDQVLLILRLYLLSRLLLRLFEREAAAIRSAKKLPSHSILSRVTSQASHLLAGREPAAAEAYAPIGADASVPGFNSPDPQMLASRSPGVQVGQQKRAAAGDKYRA